MNACSVCAKILDRKSYKYCSNKCQAVYQHEEYIRKWKLGLVSGDRGISTKNISAHIKRYLIEKYGEECYICQWKTKNSVTQKVPLEIDHINGDAGDNNEKNLRLICPNCHSLSVTFRNLNNGRGRSWRRLKYIKNIN